jgi:DNA polymerase-3 subunit epsilon
MYAVIDVETTGLRTSWHDRIVEIAVVLLDESGRPRAEWCTLVNPDRDLGPQHIHGISASEARRAPAFHEIAGQLGSLLRGNVVVAHNLAFDARFVAAAFANLGITAPIGHELGLCTMRLAALFLPSAGRSLQDCRRAAGLPPHRAHSALHDARAAAELLIRYLDLAGSPSPWAEMLVRAQACQWPPLPPAQDVEVRRTSPEHREQHFLTRLIDRLPRQREPRADAYLDLLDRALVDRHISASEADALVATAEDFGLARADVEYLHEQYLQSLVEIALEDHVLTAAERHDLDGAATALGLPASAVDEALKCDSPERRPRQSSACRPWRLQPNDAVVFTGAMSPPREVWQAEAIAAGLKVGESVTKKTRLLVAADPDSMSGKAKKARQYGVPIARLAAYQDMLRNLGVSSDGGRNRAM